MKKKHKTSRVFRLRHPREIGKFYNVNDNKGGHPGRVFYSNPDEDIYYIVKFSTKPRKDRIKLKHSIDPDRNNDQYVIKKATSKKYDDLIYKEKYITFRVHDEDLATIKMIESKYLKEK